MQGSFSVFLTLGLMLAALLTVFAGLGVMVKGGKVNEKYANTLMRLRIGLQAAALVAFAAYFFTR